MDGKNRSPHQTFPPDPNRKVPEYSDADILPKRIVTRSSRARMLYGPSGDLKPKGAGPAPEDYMLAPDLAGLPWAREHYDAWTTPEFRAVVLDWMERYCRQRQPQGVIGWRIVEKATSNGALSTRLNDRDQHLRFEVIVRLDEDRTATLETATTFPDEDRTPARAAVVLESVAVSLDAMAEAIGYRLNGG